MTRRKGTHISGHYVVLIVATVYVFSYIYVLYIKKK